MEPKVLSIQQALAVRGRINRAANLLTQNQAALSAGIEPIVKELLELADDLHHKLTEATEREN